MRFERLAAWVRTSADGSPALSALEAAKRIDVGPYADWTEPARLVFNVERAYRELRGEPFDAPIDAVALFRQMYELETART